MVYRDWKYITDHHETALAATLKPISTYPTRLARLLDLASGSLLGSWGTVGETGRLKAVAQFRILGKVLGCPSEIGGT